jgi:hypothetical protein
MRDTKPATAPRKNAGATAFEKICVSLSMLGMNSMLNCSDAWDKGSALKTSTPMSALPPIATAKADMPQMVMSALPPKVDMCSALAHVRFGPKADIASEMKEAAN